MRPRRPTFPDWVEMEDEEDQLSEKKLEESEEKILEDETGDEEEESNEELPFPGYEPVSLGFLHQNQKLRYLSLCLVNNLWFDRVTMVVIFINCITLGMYRPCEDGPECETYRCWLLSLIDHTIFAYFAAEMAIKIVAFGFWGETAYLGDGWNRLDFFIVLAGIAEYLLSKYLGNLNLTAIRTIRVLRPLRAVNRIPSLRILVNLLLDTLPMLGNVLLLCFFVFFIFGIIGVQLWAGLLRNRCVIELPSSDYLSLMNFSFPVDISLSRYYIPQDTSLDYICSQPDSSGLHSCENLPQYKSDGKKCNLSLFDYNNEKNNDSCINWNNYYSKCQGSVSFDNIGFAWVAIFLVISLEGWTDIMYYVQDAHSFWNWIYFVLLIVIGAFFMCLVVIATQFAETKRRETQRMLEERKCINSDSLLASEFGSISQSGLRDNAEGDSVYGAFVRVIRRTFQRTRRLLIRTLREFRKKQTKTKQGDGREKGDENLVEGDDGKLTHEDKGKIEKERLNGKISSIEIQKVDDNNNKEHSRRRQSRRNTEMNPSPWRDFKLRIRSFVCCDHFTRGILIAILVNTLSMGVEYHQQPEILTTLLEYSNLFFTALFALEMLLKIVAYGLFGYIQDGFNLFDGGIVALSVLELFQEGKGGLSVLRTFRLLRILKLVRFMPALRYQLVVMLRTMDNILTCEDWNMVLFNGMSHTTPWAALYFVTLMTFGNYVLFNLLVAILVEGFQESKEEEKRQLEEEALKRAEEEENERKMELEMLIARTTLNAFLKKKCSCGQDNITVVREQLGKKIIENERRKSRQFSISVDNKDLMDVRQQQRRRRESYAPGRRLTWQRHSSLSVPRGPHFDGMQQLLINPRNIHQPVEQSQSEGERPRLASWSNSQFNSSHSLNVHSSLFDPQCPLHGHRAILEAYTREKYLKASEELQHALAEEQDRVQQKRNICLNCVTLAMERPSIPPQSAERFFLSITGYAFTLIFTLEMVAKIIANGCFYGSDAYFKDGWNILDGCLVLISLVNVIMEIFVSGDSPKIFGVIRVLRLLRALRPLRVINRAPGVKLVVMTLISSLKPIGNIVLICCTFFIIFGILGVQLFKGTMFHCVGPHVQNVSTRSECLIDPNNRWINHRYNFDNLGQALMSLFVLSSKDGWVSIMYQGIDAVGVDMQPIENYNEWRMIYFISFLLLVGFFVLNMFVGVVVDNFHKCKETLEAEMREKAQKKKMKRRLKRQQFAEIELIKKKKEKVKSHPYWAKYGRKRAIINNVVTSKYFDLAISAVIGLNVVSMAMEFYMMPNGLRYLLRALNYLFTAVFTLEAAAKLYALGFGRFFAERWNQLDMFIVLLSIAGIIFEEFEALELPINPTIIRVMRVLRIARVLKLLKMAKGIRSLLDTVGEALPQVGNLGSLFFLLFFIFAALGVELFGRLECSEEHPCDGLGEHAHFKNFGMAFLTLFRIATGDNWNGIMKDALRDDCDPSDRCERNCCVDPILAPCFFVIFVLISQFVLVNVVVAVLMKHLEESTKRDDAAEGKTKGLQDLEKPIEKGLTTEGISEIERDLIEVEECLVRSGQQSASLSLPRPSLTVFDVTSHLMLKNDNKTLRRQRSSPSQRIMAQHSFNSNYEGSIPAKRYSLRQKMPFFGTTTERQSFGAPSEVVLAEIEERISMLPLDLSPHLHTDECNFLIRLYKECEQTMPFFKRVILQECDQWKIAAANCLHQERIYRRDTNPKYAKRLVEHRRLPEDRYTPTLKRLKEEGKLNLDEECSCRR
uniref:Ion transport domain-containing protein n=4 Tax=Meloidogyne TaxID=189290 RepID=A0A915MCL9_MELJA